MKKLLLALSLGASALAGMPGVAFAQTQTAPPPPDEPARDGQMRDRMMTRADAIARADRRFDEIDANHDGKITRDEMAAAPRPMHHGARGDMPPPGNGTTPPPPPGGKKLMRDLDRDGVITRQEWRDRELKRFDRMDTNHDGVVDANERAAFRDLMRMRRIDGGAEPAPLAPQDAPPAPQPQ